MSHANPVALPSAVNSGPSGFHLEHLKLDFTNIKNLPLMMEIHRRNYLLVHLVHFIQILV